MWHACVFGSNVIVIETVFVMRSTSPSLKFEFLHQLADCDALLHIQVAVRLLLEEAEHDFHRFARFFGACRRHVR